MTDAMDRSLPQMTIDASAMAAMAPQAGTDFDVNDDDTLEMLYARDTAAAAAKENNIKRRRVARVPLVPFVAQSSSSDAVVRPSHVVRVTARISSIHSGSSSLPITAPVAIASHGAACLIAGRNIHLLDHKLSSLMATITCCSDSEPAAAAFSRDGNFIIIGDASGALHFVHVESQDVMFSHRVGSSQIVWIDSIHSQTDGMEELLVVTANNVLFRFSNFDMFKLDDGVRRRDPPSVRLVRDAVGLEQVDLSTCLSPGGFRCLTVVQRDLAECLSSEDDVRVIVCGDGSSPLSVWSCGASATETLPMRRLVVEVASSSIRAGVRKCVATNDGRLLIVLDELNVLSVWDADMLVQLFVFPEPIIADFEVIPSSVKPEEEVIDAAITESDESVTVDDAKDQIKLVVLSTIRISGRFIAVVTCPGFSLVTHFAVPDDVALVKFDQLRQDPDVPFVERAGGSLYLHQIVVDDSARNNYSGGGNNVDDVAVAAEPPTAVKPPPIEQQSSAPAPEDTIARVNSILSSITPEWDSKKIASVVRDIEDCIRSTEDTWATIMAVLDAEVDSEGATYQLITSCINLHKHHQSNIEDSDAMAFEEAALLTSTMRRLNTFTTLAAFSDISDNFDPISWQIFRRCDLFGNVCARIAAGDIDGASVIWTRHANEEKWGGRVVEALRKVRADVDVVRLCGWLWRDVIPALDSEVTRLEFSKWVCRLALEVVRARESPHMALKVIEMASTRSRKAEGVLLDGPGTPATFVKNTVLLVELVKSQRESGQDAADVETLAGQLKDVVRLWDEYDFRVTLDEYIEAGPNRIALDMLARAESFDELPDAIESFKRYTAFHGLDFDAKLVEHCVEHITTNDVPALWEDRVLFIIQHIADAESRASVVLEIMQHAAVPWSERIDHLIQQTLSRDAGISQTGEVLEQYRLMKLSLLVQRLGFSNDCLNLSNASALLRAVLSRTKNCDAMTDAMLIVSSFSNISKTFAYTERLRHLFRRGLFDRALNLLRTGYEYHRCAPLKDDVEISLSLTDKVAVGMGCVTWGIEIVEELAERAEDADDDENELIIAEYQSATSTLVELLPAVIDLQRELAHLESMTMESKSGPPVNRSCYTDCGLGEELSEMLATATCLKSLATEFSVVCGFAMRMNGDEADKRKVLGRFSRGVFTSDACGDNGVESKRTLSNGTELSQTALSRLAELLGYDRSRLSGIIAEEAAVNGDIKTAFILARELQDNFPGPETAQTLRNVTQSICGFIAQNKKLLKELKASKANARLTKWLLELSQYALASCDGFRIGDYLDAFKNLEAMHLIFRNCDSGDYSNLISRSIFSSESSMSSATSSSSSSSSVPIEPPIIQADVEVGNITDPFGSDLFSSLYHEAGLVLSTENIMPLANAYVCESFASLAIETSESEAGKSSDKHAAPCPIEAATTLWRELQRNRNNILAFRVFHRMVEDKDRQAAAVYPDDAAAEDKESALSLHISLSSNLLSSKSLDQRLALGHMLALDDDKMNLCYNLFKKSLAAKSNDHHEILKLTEVGGALGNMWSQRAFSAQCEEIAIKSGWANYFSLLGIEFDKNAIGFHSRDPAPARALVLETLRKTNFDVITCLEFGRCFGVEDDFVLLSYVSHLILYSMDPSYQDCVIGVVPDITNKDKLFTTLMEMCLPSVSGYDYERLLFICSTALLLRPEDATAKINHTVLEVLVHYARINPPRDEENEIEAARVSTENSADSKGAAAPTLSAKRVSFHYLMKDPWMFVDDELSDTNINRLAPIVNVLGLPLDELYRRAVLWWINHIGEDNSERVKFTDVKPLLGKIADAKIAFELSSRVAQAFPGEAEKIAAHKAAISFGERWSHLVDASVDGGSGVDDIKAAIATLKAALSIIETEQQLRFLGFTEFLQYARKPLELVERLYYLKAEEAYKCGDTFNLHSIVNDIGKRHSCDVEKLRNMLLTNWITVDLPKSKDDHLYLPSLRMQLHNALFSAEERSLQTRILYLFQSVTRQKAISFLMATFGSPSGKIRTAHRIRALSVLLQMAEPADLNASNTSVEQTVELLNLLLYLLDFEELNIVQTMMEFKDCDKHALARSLWVNKDAEPRVVQLICNICLDYKIFDTQLWENALARLIDTRSFAYLIGMIEAVSIIPELAVLRGWDRIWCAVIDGGLHDVAGRFDVVDIQIFDRLASLLQRCPCGHMIDMEKILNLFFRGGIETVGRDFHRALIILAACGQTSRSRKLAKDLLVSLPNERLLRTLNEVTASPGILDSFAGKTIIVEEINKCVEAAHRSQKLKNARKGL